MLDNIPLNDQTDSNTNNIFYSDSYSHARSAQVLRHCNKLVVRGPSWASLPRDLDLALRSHPALLLQLDCGLAFQSAFDKQGSYPSLVHSFDTFTHHDPLIYRNYSTVVVESRYISVTSDSCMLHAFLPPNKSRTREQRTHSVLLAPSVSMASVPLLPNSS